MKPMQPGDTAPAMSFPLATGGRLDLAQCRGNPLLLVFLRHLQ